MLNGFINDTHENDTINDNIDNKYRSIDEDNSIQQLIINDVLDLSFQNISSQKFSSIITAFEKENIKGLKSFILAGNRIELSGIKIFYHNIKCFLQLEYLNLEYLYLDSNSLKEVSNCLKSNLFTNILVDFA